MSWSIYFKLDDIRNELCTMVNMMEEQKMQSDDMKWISSKNGSWKIFYDEPAIMSIDKYTNESYMNKINHFIILMPVIEEDVSVSEKNDNRDRPPPYNPDL